MHWCISAQILHPFYFSVALRPRTQYRLIRDGEPRTSASIVYVHCSFTSTETIHLLGTRRPQDVSNSTSTQLLSPVMHPLPTIKTITVWKLTLKLCYLFKCHNPSFKILTATQFYPQSLTTSKPNNNHVQPKPNFKAHSTRTAVENHAPHKETKETKRGETKGRQPKQPKAKVR